MNSYAESEFSELSDLDLNDFSDFVPDVEPEVEPEVINEENIIEASANANSDERESTKDKIASIRQLPLSKQLGPEVVALHVGPEPIIKLFVVHKRLLCAKSEIFHTMFHGRFQEALTNSAYLRDDNPEAFESLVEWLYHGDFTIGDCEAKDLCSSMLYVVVAIATLAVRYAIPELVDRAVTRFVYIAKYFSPATTVLHVRSIYEGNPPGSMFRKLLARSVAFHILKTTRRGEREESQGQLIEDFRFADGLLEDVVPLLRGMAGQEIYNPLMVPPCEYHEHPPAEHCPYKTKGPSVD